MKNRIAGVSVSTENPPKREELVKQALKGRDYQNFNQPEALEAINKEIDKSGLYKSDTSKSEKPAKPVSGGDTIGDIKPAAGGKKTDKKQVANG